MTNLLPPEGHKVLKRERLLRLVSTSSFLLVLVTIFLTVALIPTYVLIQAQIKAFEAEGQKSGGDQEVFALADAEVQKTKTILEQLMKTPESLQASEVIDEIATRAPASISFLHFDVVVGSGKISMVRVQGKAPSREALSEFKRSAEESDMFETVEVPISDLARDADLTFAVTVTLSGDKK